MKKRPLLLFAIIFLTACAIFQYASAATTFPFNGGTGSTTLSGILIGNGTSPVNTLTIGSNLTLTGTTLSASGGGSGFSTTSALYFSSVGLAFSTTSTAYYLTQFPPASFSTTSANFWSSVGLAFSTTSTDYWLTTKGLGGFSTTSANFWASVGLAFSTTSNDYYKSVNNFFSTTSASNFAANGLAFSTTSENYYFQSSTTVPTTYKANTFTGLQAFSNTGTTTFGGGIDFTRFNLSATSTGSQGINLSGGCFAINGVCLQTSGSVSGGTIGMLTAWTSATTQTATGTPTAASYFATSTTATSTYLGNLKVNGNLLVGSTTPAYGYVLNDKLSMVDSLNDYLDINTTNRSSGPCATADLVVQNDSATVSSYFGNFGHTSSGFTGSGCANNPFTGFGANSTYVFDPDGDVNFAIGSSTSATQSYKWFGKGYAAGNKLMTLSNAGALTLTSPTATSSFASSLNVGTGMTYPRLDVGTTTSIPEGGGMLPQIMGLFHTQGTNDFATVASYNGGSGPCTTAAFDAANNLTDTASDFNELGQTGGGFTGVGCAFTAYPGFGADAGYLLNFTGRENIAAGTTIDFFTGGQTAADEKMTISQIGNIGIGTTTPLSNLTIQRNFGSITPNIFQVASSTASTGNTFSNFLSVSSTGFGTTTLAGLNIAGSATSTSNVGFNITSGCFAINGVCQGNDGTFSTTSASYFSSLGLAFSTTSNAYFLSQNQGAAFSTTSANNWSTFGLGFSTTSDAFFASVGRAHSTTSVAYQLSQNIVVGNSTSTTIFATTASSTTAFFNNATTTNFGVTNGFTQTNASATSSFAGGVNFAAINFTATSTGSKGINLTGGCFAINGTCLTSSAGSSASTTLLADFNTWTGTNTYNTSPTIGVNTNGLLLGGNVWAYASSTNQSTIFGIGAGGNVATTSATNVHETAIGFSALSNETTGDKNTALGFQALNLASTSALNTAVGYLALAGSGTGTFSASGANTAVGAIALQNLSTGMFNTGIGEAALNNVTSGTSNTAVGLLALSTMTSGAFNVGIGRRAGSDVTTGYDNIFIDADITPGGSGHITAGGGNIGIGMNVLFPSVSTNLELNIGNSIFGVLPATTSATTLPLPIGNSLGIGTSTPWGKLSVQTNNGDTFQDLFVVASSTASATSTLLDISNTGDIYTVNPATGDTKRKPTLGSCGTATITATSTDARGLINITAGTPTQCNITFSTPKRDTPTCISGTNSLTLLSNVTNASTTGVQFGLSAAFSGKLSYICEL